MKETKTSRLCFELIYDSATVTIFFGAEHEKLYKNDHTPADFSRNLANFHIVSLT